MIYDVILIGAGVVGALTARELARYELSVLVLEAEPDAAMGATKANSAIVHGGFAEGTDTLKGRLAVAGRRAFAALEDELHFGYRVTGSLVVDTGDDPSRLEALYQQGLSNGLSDLELWSGDRVREREPAVAKSVRRALWCEGAGVCSPWDLAYAALENAVAHGVEVRLSHRVEAVEGPLAEPGRWRLTAGGFAFSSRYVINAAGFGGAAVDALAGLNDVPLSPRTGEYLVFAQGTGALVRSVIFPLPGPLGKGILVAPTYQNNLLVGPDARNEDPASLPSRSTHRQRLEAVVAQASQVVNGLDLKKAIRSFTGVRAGALGGDFVVGAADRLSHPGWHRAVGIQSPGLTASPVLAHRLIEGLAEDGLRLHRRAAFDPSRRPLAAHLSRRAPPLPFVEADALTRLEAGDPARVVCRCEQVREQDLAEACSRGLAVTTVDALKRRTRAGMGWCQGRFCRPRVAAWLEQRLGEPVAAVDDVVRSGWSRVEGRALWSLADPPPT